MGVIGARHDLANKPSPLSISKKYIQMNENCDINLESTHEAKQKLYKYETNIKLADLRLTGQENKNC